MIGKPLFNCSSSRNPYTKSPDFKDHKRESDYVVLQQKQKLSQKQGPQAPSKMTWAWYRKMELDRLAGFIKPPVLNETDQHGTRHERG